MHELTISVVLLTMSLFSATGQKDQLVFGDSSGMVLVRVKADALDKFESALTTLRSALMNSKNDTRRKQADGWKIYLSHEGMEGNLLYVFVIDPVVPDADYSIERLLAELPPDIGQAAVAQFAASVISLHRLTLSRFPRAADSSLPEQVKALMSSLAATSTIDVDPSAVTRKCTKDWPDDFVIRRHCEKQQQDSVQKLKQRSMTTPAQRTIRSKCEKDWPDDFVMRNSCEEKQLKALSGGRE